MMNDTENEFQEIAEEEGTPDVADLQAAVRALAGHHGEINDRQVQGDNVRQCLWEGQAADGRKHRGESGEEPHPFDGATDSRVRLADTVIRERKALLLEAATKSKPVVGGVESNDAELASRITNLVKWLRDSKLKLMLFREVQLAAEYFIGDCPAACVVGVFWDQRESLSWRDITKADLAKAQLERLLGAVPQGVQVNVAALAQKAGQEIDSLVMEGSQHEDGGQAAAFIAQLFPKARAATLGQCVKDLQSTGSGRFIESYLRVNQPRWITYRLNEDIFLPTDIDDMDRMPYVFVRDVLTRTGVESRAAVEGWSEAFKESILKANKVSLVPERKSGEARTQVNATSTSVSGAATQGLSATSGTEAEERFEVWTGFVRTHDEEGVEGIYRTVFGAVASKDGEKTLYGSHELLDYPHGKMPFVMMQAEVLSRSVLDSRGIPELIGSHQTEIKIQRDTRGDNAMLSTLPPILVHMRRGGFKLQVGPLAQIPKMRDDDFSRLDLGNAYPNTSIEMERAVKGEVDELLARRHPEADPSRVAREEWMTLLAFMIGIGECWVQTIQLCQKFMSPLTWQRVIGGSYVPMQMSREEIQGQFDLTFYIDTRDSDMAFLKLKLDYFMQMAQLDDAGVMNKASLVQFGAHAVDANLADIVITDAQTATEQERKEEQMAVVGMASGVEPDLAKMGVNAQLRLQTMFETIQRSQQLSRRYQFPQEGDNFKELVDNRAKNLQFLIQQQGPNKMAGRQGALPVT